MAQSCSCGCCNAISYIVLVVVADRFFRRAGPERHVMLKKKVPSWISTISLTMSFARPTTLSITSGAPYKSGLKSSEGEDLII